ncbi:hypothetical protein V6N12_029712 [Hibiscus sabdariffa]|uniref:Uncharacterized protein n=1 Tax=Hibiscus sabdariffa TaxID=183260 RepID=A0ABR2CWZ7_9ROSI
MADALISAVSQQLTSILFQEAESGLKLVMGVKQEELRKLNNTFQTIRAVLVDAEKRQLKEHAIKVWLDKVQNVSYDIEDVLDDWKILTLRLQITRDRRPPASIVASKVRSWIHSPSSFVRRAIQRYNIAVKIKKLDERLQVIAKEKDDYAFTVDLNRKTDLERERPITTSFIDPSDIHGRDGDKNMLLNILLGQNKGEEKGVPEERFLLVLDDVWGEDDRKWQSLKYSLDCGSQESKILMTTRKENVAVIMGSSNLFRLGKLSKDECWSLFSRLAFFGRKDKERECLEDIGLLGEMQHKDVEIIGEEYFDNLVVHSFFQEFEKDENDNSIISCKMHEIVHDFTLYLRRTKSLLVESNNAEELNMDCKARHLTLIHDEAVAIPAPLFDVKKLRSLHLNLNDTSAVGASLAKLLDRLTCLRILSFKDMNSGYKGSIKVIPKEIGNLLHLRYLNLEGNTDLEKLPETVCDLCNLQTLNIRSCKNLMKLPRGIGKLINLRHLQNAGTDRCRFMPRGLRQLTSLRTLDEFVVSRGDVESKSCSLGDLGNLIHLRGDLEIRGLGNVGDLSVAKKAQLWTKHGLRGLRLKFDPQEIQQVKLEDEKYVFEALQPPSHLETLSILHCRGPLAFPNTMTTLCMLKRVRLQNCLNWESLPPLGKLQSLESLEIEYMNKVKKVGDEFLGTSCLSPSSSTDNKIAFPVLKKLKFHYMKEWEKWEYGNVWRSRGDESVAIMPRLHSLTINYCVELKALPSHLLRNTMLQELHIKGCPVLGERLEKGRGVDWPSISHISTIQIDDELGLIDDELVL